jgi:hypothetical protein
VIGEFIGPAQHAPMRIRSSAAGAGARVRWWPLP